MTEALYMNDSYLKAWKAKIVSIKDNKYLILDKTAFYPKGGGQPWVVNFADSYLKSWNAKVLSVTDNKYVILNRTAFYPKGGVTFLIR